MGIDGESASTFAKDGYFCGIAAEGMDVSLDPVKS
jgi:hypothetical protein